MAGMDDVEGEAAAGRFDLWEPVILAEPVVGESALPSLTGATDAVADDTPSSDKRWGRLRWLFTRRLCFGGLAGALECGGGELRAVGNHLPGAGGRK